MGATLKQQQERLTYTTLTGIFIVGLVLFGRQSLALASFDFLLLFLATLRLGRLVAFDKIFSTYREPFTQLVHDGGGLNVTPKGTGIRRAVGELIACPICAGTWIAALLVYAHRWQVVRTFIAIQATAGAIEVLHAMTEAFQWTGEVARDEAE